MFRYILLFISSAILNADDISISINKHYGESAYIVTKPEQNLKAELLFPFNFESLNLSFKHILENYTIAFDSDFLLHSDITIGEDYDWYNNQLSVYSTSKNTINNFQKYNLKISKELIKNLSLVGSLKYQIIDFSWSNSKEKDFIKDEVFTNKSVSLEYKQKFYQLNMGLNYKKIFKGLTLEIEPKLIYTHIYSKDIHTLRNFYTKQTSNAVGYGLKTNISKNLTSHSTLALHFNYETYKDSNTKMHYYNQINYKYMTLPSSYTYKHSTFGINYIHHFNYYE